ncbi:MAG: hypothetical protein QG599_740 [Pseudomonadota bacterium]|nr:hypothetical protein [Pseudomonadota bacterium]
MDHGREFLAVQADRDRREPFHLGNALAIQRPSPEGVPVGASPMGSGLGTVGGFRQVSAGG